MPLLSILRTAVSVSGSLVLGLGTGLLLRDELKFPTYLRIKHALLEYYSTTRGTPPPEVLDMIEIRLPHEEASLAKEFEDVKSKRADQQK